MKNNDQLADRYKFSAQYIDDYNEFKYNLINKTIIPHQVEFQPPPRSSKKICWLECPYCYGLSAKDNGDRMVKERAIEVMHQIANGSVKKVIFAGYATDPLNSPYLEDLLEIAIDNKMVFGFNTKAIKTSPRLLELLTRTDIVRKSYMSFSIDAGSNEVYNAIHNVSNKKAKLYDRVLNNVIAVAKAREESGALYDISAVYLVNIHNNSIEEVSRFITDFKDAGCNLLRFTFPQPPRGIHVEDGVVPSDIECRQYKEKLSPIIKAASSDDCLVMIVDADSKHDIFHKPRTVPCFARFIYPTVGFDGWLYHCSQSSSPNFRPMALGNLNIQDFWDVFYDYDVTNIADYFSQCTEKMAKTGCRCDRKMHLLNASVINSAVFDS
ncbi:MAG: radical SAM protein [Mariprofundales bacterium]